ncbi:unnamed protein product, partial [Effrenium voratum]
MLPLDFALKTYAFGLIPRLGFEVPFGPVAPEMKLQKVADSLRHACPFALLSWVSFVFGKRWEVVPCPTEIPGAPGFTTLAAGEGGCLGITPEGDVHRWAAGAKAGKVTRGFAMEWSLSMLKDEAGQHLQLRDVALGGFSRKSSYRIAAIALMDSGDVFSSQAWYGDGGDGQKGSAPMACPAWVPWPSLQSTLVVAVACGSGFCMALTAHGELMAWGEAPDGALGLGGSAASEPTLVPGLARCRVAAVACGESHTVAACFDEEDQPGAVYSWGLAKDGRLGYLDEVNQREPRVIPWLTAELG